MGFALRLLVSLLLFVCFSVIAGGVLAALIEYAYRFVLFGVPELARNVLAIGLGNAIGVWVAVWVVKKVVRHPPRRTLAAIGVALFSLSAVGVLMLLVQSGDWKTAAGQFAGAAAGAATSFYLLWRSDGYEGVLTEEATAPSSN